MFDAAIKHLDRAIDSADTLCGDGFPVNFSDSCRAAIRVLEAAGGFTADDKERLEKALDQIPFYIPLEGYKCPGQVLRDKFKALLAALPDGDKK
ncbi:MAG: hypothetical protein M0R06_08720 [Sphaerochaeta sp.]|jgi:hypothetical protein|nr:hypothetical protein [Sphaerochaeta sp.]